MVKKTRIQPRKSPRQRRSQTTVDAILQAASRVLVKDGYAATTTTRVARVAGVSIGSLYQYFPSKEALVAALVDDHIAKITALLSQAMPTLVEAPLDDAVRGFVQTVLRIHALDPRLHAVLTQNFSEVEGFEKVRALNENARAMVASTLRRIPERVRPTTHDLAAFVLVHAVQGVVSAAVVDETVRLDDERLVDELATLVSNFLQKTPSK